MSKIAVTDSAPTVEIIEESDEAAPVVKPVPITDPADLFTLVGRFIMTFVLAFMTVGAILKHSLLWTFVLGTASFFVQRATTKLYKRLRAERETVAQLEPAPEQNS